MTEQDSIFAHRTSPAWQKAMALVVRVYELSRTFPDAERFGLTSQLRRAVISVSSNIAEGKGRLSSSEMTHFLGIARGSVFEVATQLEIAIALGYVTSADASDAQSLAAEIVRMLNASVRTMRERAT